MKSYPIGKDHSSDSEFSFPITLSSDTDFKQNVGIDTNDAKVIELNDCVSSQLSYRSQQNFQFYGLCEEGTQSEDNIDRQSGV